MDRIKNQKSGKLGEEIACKYLLKKGFKIIERNFHKRYAEIDIVALEEDTLVFVEVKTRLEDKYGLPEEAITAWKIKTLIRSANYYKYLQPHLPDSLRIDAVCVYLNPDYSLQNIKYYKSITTI